MATEKNFEAETEREALELACADFGVSKEELDYTITDMGSAGLFGMGARPVKITASLIKSVSKEEAAPNTPVEAAPKKAEAVAAPKRAEAVAAPKRAEAVAAPKSSAPEEHEAKDAAAEGDESSAEPARERPARAPGIVGPAPEKVAQARAVTEALVKELKLAAKIEIRDEETEIVIVLSEEDDSTDVADLLGSTRPPALPSLQFLLNKIVNRFPDNRKHIVVEAASVSERITARKAEAAVRRQENSKAGKKTLPDDIDEEMVAIARALVEKANAIGKVITIFPMSAGDRRSIHQTVMTIEEADTVSEGDGLFRRIHVIPEALKTKRSGGNRRRGRGPREEREAQPEEQSEAQPTNEVANDATDTASDNDAAAASAPVVDAPVEAETANP